MFPLGTARQLSQGAEPCFSQEPRNGLSVQSRAALDALFLLEQPHEALFQAAIFSLVGAPGAFAPSVISAF